MAIKMTMKSMMKNLPDVLVEGRDFSEIIFRALTPEP